MKLVYHQTCERIEGTHKWLQSVIGKEQRVLFWGGIVAFIISQHGGAQRHQILLARDHPSQMAGATCSSVPFPPHHMAESPPAPQPRPPRVWLISSACNALGHAIALAALQLGESVAAGCTPEEIRSDGDGALQELRTAAGGSNRLVIVELDTRNIALCQSALAETVYAFRRIDVVLNCTSQCLWFPSLPFCSAPLSSCLLEIPGS